MRPLAGLTGLVQDVFLDILSTGEALKADIDELLKEHGLTTSQYNVLRILRGAGTDGLTCHEIIDLMITRDPDITRLLDRLEKRDLVTRTRAKTDRRVVRSCLTEEGLQIVEALDDPVAELHVRQLGHLGEEQIRVLEASLRSIREKLGTTRASSCGE